MAQSGMSVPAYAYAANDPLRYVDSTGREIRLSGNSGDIIAGSWALGAALGNRDIGGKVARLMMDPNNIALLTTPKSAFVATGGGFTVTPKWGSKGKYFCQSSASLDGHLEFLRSLRPPPAAWLPPMSQTGVTAHELGHSYAELYGLADSDAEANSWENAIRRMEGSPERPADSNGNGVPDEDWPRWQGPVPPP